MRRRIDNRQEAIGHPSGNYLTEVASLHLGNVGKFSKGKITGKDRIPETRQVPQQMENLQDKASMKGNPNEKAGYYRPVALLSAMGRIFEEIVAERMDNYAEDRGWVEVLKGAGSCIVCPLV